MSTGLFDEFQRADPFDEFSRAPSPRDTLKVATRVNPDQAAEANRLAARYPNPHDVVLRNLADVKLQAAVDDADARLRTDVPTLQRKMTELPFAQVSHDDTGPLSSIEGLIRQTGRSAKSGVFGAARGAAGVFQAGLELVAPTLDVLEAETPEDFAGWRGAVGGNPLRRLAEGFAAMGRQNLQIQQSLRPQEQLGNIGSGFFSGVESLTQNLLTLPLAFAPGGQPAALGSMAGFTGGQSYQDARDKGLGMSQALPFAASQAAIEYATEKLPLGRLIGDVRAGTPFFQTLARQVAAEIPSEQVATILQDLNEWAVLNPDKPFTSYLEERPSAAAQTLVATIVGAGGNVAVAKGIEQVANIAVRQDAQLAKSDADTQRLADTMAVAAESKLRERAPETFAQFVQQAAENTDAAPTAVYVDPRTFTDALNQAGISDEQLAQLLPSVAPQIADAFESGTPIEIPIGEALAAVPGTALEEVLLQNARTEPDGLSRVEVDEAAQQAETLLRQEADRIMAAAEQRAAADEQAAQVKQTVLDQLNTAGRFRPEANDAYATMVGAFYGTMAQRLGTTPSELYARYPLRVTGEMQTQAALEQGKVRKVFHRTKQTFDEFDTQFANENNEHGTAVYFSDNRDSGQGYGPNLLERELHGQVLNEEQKPKPEQIDAIQSALDDLGYSVRTDRAMRASTLGTALEEIRQQLGDLKDGNDILNDALMSLGVVARSYTEADGSTSYAVFDLDALKRTDTLAQQTRATFSPEQMLIALGPNADYSSFLHEMGHAWLEILNDIATQPGAPEQIAKDWQTTLDWFGVTAEQWASMTLDEKRPYHERFAESTEQYFFEGKAPSTELRGVFDRFRTWLTSVYRSLKQFIAARPNNDVPLSDEVRAVMDRLLATDEQIAEAERVRQYGLLFKSPEEAGMTPEQWLAYTSEDEKAHAEALAELSRRSLRDMGIVMRKRMRALREVQRDMAEKRKAVEAEAAQQIAAEAVYRAMRWLKKGEMTTPAGEDVQGEEIKATDGYKLDAAVVAELFPETMLGRPDLSKLRGMTTKKGGLHPDIVAEMFGYPDGAALITAITQAFPQAEQVGGLTDRMMLERYGDLSTPRGMERAADEAVHNEARARVLAAEMAAISRANDARTPTAGGRTANAMVEAAKQFAARVVERKKVKDLKPQLYTAAETRAARAAEKALAKGDTQAVIQAKRDQLLNFQTARAANAARTEALKIEAFFKKIASAKDDTVGKTRDLDVVKATQAILAGYGIGTRGEQATAYLDAVKANDPAMYAAIEPSVTAALLNAKPLGELTVEELRSLNEEVQALWYLAKRSRQMEIDGNLLDRQDVEDALKARMQEIGIPDSMPGDTRAITPAEQRALKLKYYLAAARRAESWVQAMDGSERMGSFRRYVWNPVKDAADAYRADKADHLKRFRDLLAPIQKTLVKRKIEAPELGYTFGEDTSGVGLSEVLHAILHTGNDSNKRKLLLGRKWATENPDGTLDTSRWDAFIQRLVSEGTLRKEHFDFAQGVWDLLEAMKPMAQKTHRDVFGKYFAEVTANPVSTPFGIYRGGYVPAIADSRIVSDKATKALMEAENESLQFAFPTTNRGFTKGRVESYTRPLLLDLRTLTQHIDKVLLFSHLEQPVRDVRKVLTAKGVAYGLNRIDPVAFDGVLTPWLNRAARQVVETPIPGDGGLSRFFSALRNRAGMAAMFANFANAAQQVTGFSLAAVRVPPRYLVQSAASYMAAPRATAQSVAEKSPYMASRMENEVSQMTGAINDILLDPSVYQKVQTWTQKHAYFLQAAVDNVMSPIIWTGAYNQALEQGATEKDAVRQADSVVRETQGSTLPEDVSRIETGNPFVRMFTQFMGYFNMQANLLGTEVATISRELGLRKGAGRALYVMLFGFLAPAWVAEIIVQAFRGGPDDEDKDGEFLDDWLAAVFGLATLRGAAALVPGIGPVATTLFNTFNDKPYDDRINTSPAISMIETGVKLPAEVYKAIADDSKEVNAQKLVRDTATVASLLTGIPFSAVAKPLGYAAAVEQGRVEPTSPADAARGAVTGVASPESKQR